MDLETIEKLLDAKFALVDLKLDKINARLNRWSAVMLWILGIVVSIAVPIIIAFLIGVFL